MEWEETSPRSGAAANITSLLRTVPWSKLYGHPMSLKSVTFWLDVYSNLILPYFRANYCFYIAILCLLSSILKSDSRLCIKFRVYPLNILHTMRCCVHSSHLTCTHWILICMLWHNQLHKFCVRIWPPNGSCCSSCSTKSINKRHEKESHGSVKVKVKLSP
jgi:hypothetical protein